MNQMTSSKLFSAHSTFIIFPCYFFLKISIIFCFCSTFVNCPLWLWPCIPVCNSGHFGSIRCRCTFVGLKFVWKALDSGLTLKVAFRIGLSSLFPFDLHFDFGLLTVNGDVSVTFVGIVFLIADTILMKWGRPKSMVEDRLQTYVHRCVLRYRLKEIR